jgi:hypothetical protein
MHDISYKMHTMHIIDDYNGRSTNSFSNLSFCSERTVSPLHYQNISSNLIDE